MSSAISCIDHVEQPECYDPQFMSLDEAKLIYQDAQAKNLSAETKADSKKHAHFFKRTSRPDWNKYKAASKRKVQRIDVDVSEEDNYYALGRDNSNNLFVYHCSHKISIMKRTDVTQRTSVYNYYLLKPLGNSRAPVPTIEIYASLSGRIGAVRLTNDDWCFEFFIGNDEKRHDLIVDYLRYRFKCYLNLHVSLTKGGGDICPNCGRDNFHEFIQNWRVCQSCGYVHGYDIIEECYIMGDYSGEDTGGSDCGGYEWIDPFGDESGTEPDTGGSGASGDATSNTDSAQNNAEDQTNGPDSLIRKDTTLTIPNKPTIKINTVIERDRGEIADWEKNIITSLNELFSNENLTPLFYAIREKEITINFKNRLPSGNVSEYVKGSRTINTSICSQHILAEEFFHLYQYHNPSFSNMPVLNYEIEAKCYIIKTWGLDYILLRSNSYKEQTMWRATDQYFSSRTEENLNILKQAIVAACDCNGTYTLLSNMLPNITLLLRYDSNGMIIDEDDNDDENN